MASGHNPPTHGLLMLALKRGENIYCANLAVGLTGVLSYGLIFFCKFGNKVSKLKSSDTRSPGSSCCRC